MSEFNDFNHEDTDKIIEGQGVILDDIPQKEKKRRSRGKGRGKSFAKLVASALVFGLVAGAAFQGFNMAAGGSSSSVKVGSVSTDNKSNGDVNAVETSTSQNKDSSSVSTVVANVMPSIVAINSTINQTTTDFFGRQYDQKEEGSGSGIIIGQNDNEILIATNNHVVENASSVQIVFGDDTKVNATIKGTAPNSDLAVVAVKTSELSKTTLSDIKIATLGDSSSLKLGDMAIAIGNALGYGQSVTVGYVSALNREVTVNNVTLKLIQTDAAINPGNSGGALLNSKGEVVGINSVKYVDDSVESIGYAIPISDAIPVINELMNSNSTDKTESAFLGIQGKDVTSDYAASFNMPEGVYVGKVSKNSAAEKAGLQIGDIITGINNVKVQSMTDLQQALSYTKAGSAGTIKVETLQKGKYVEKTLNITFDSKTGK
ncbi:serine protease Do [Anaerocolumna jejuensis DSM 15929]|uniref:Serine protease Do n=1 Tax=Anaerocolumna jejuensis DSM 15929 TaxID=1121322 RepID=A0A1M6MHF3_9FIRM|nr:trypsin-like peptidase domain-containing protein [Anaerocolumna jejuensis]SHJ82868.1 serine protease Do [Anaerocolumna jejuensis DSM 15929]